LVWDKEKQRRSNLRRREKIRAANKVAGKKYRQNHPEKVREWNSTYQQTHRAERILAASRRAAEKYGWVPISVTPDELRAWLEQQPKNCAFPGCARTDRLGVDHNHLTGALRALLCPMHNFAIGFIESPGLMDAANVYMARFEPRTSEIVRVA
jgi:hypothetical protein